jgi:hypothetical protein
MEATRSTQLQEIKSITKSLIPVQITFVKELTPKIMPWSNI